MNTTRSGMAVAVYETHRQAEEAVKALHLAGFDMRKVSIVGRDYHTDEHVIGFLNAGDRARIFGKFGAFWGGLMGILFGSGMLFFPVVGHVVVLGPLAAMLFGAAEGAALLGGAGALVGALTAIGVPRNSVLRYETALKADKFMLVVHGDLHDMERAEAMLKVSGHVAFERHMAQAA